jgi:uncharacterized membrane protein
MRPTKPALLKPYLLIFSALTALGLDLSLILGLGSLPEISKFSGQYQAEARRGGGRSGGGSFRSSPPSRSSGSSSGGSSGGGSNNSPSYNRNYDSNYGRGGGNSIFFIPGGGGGYGNSQSTSDAGAGIFVALFVLLFGGISIFLLYRLFQNLMSKGGGMAELENDRVSVHKLQIALLSQARDVQSRLTEISSTIETDTAEGLHTLLQESVVALLRTPENWAYVLATVQASDRIRAEGVFNQLSLTERTKSSEESLVNVGGRLRKTTPMVADPDKDPAAYIVVTLLIGTAHDKPLYTQVKTATELEEALRKIALISSDYLLTFELLWTPQAETDSLSYDEMLSEYSDMQPI